MLKSSNEAPEGVSWVHELENHVLFGIWTNLTYDVSLSYDFTHDLDFGFLKSNFEKTVFYNLWKQWITMVVDNIFIHAHYCQKIIRSSQKNYGVFANWRTLSYGGHLANYSGWGLYYHAWLKLFQIIMNMVLNCLFLQVLGRHDWYLFWNLIPM